jgi:outer membrane lipoprotein SlyB
MVFLLRYSSSSSSSLVLLLLTTTLLLPLAVIGFAAESSSSSSTSSSTSDRRRPWEVFRFLKQSSQFVNVPFVPRRSKDQRTVRPGDVLWRADAGSSSDDNTKNVFTMGPLDDVVMGGASASTFDDATGTWSGSVTDANNGGFIGIRSTPGFEWDMTKCKGLEWKVRLVAPSSSSQQQQQRRFKFVVRDSAEFNGITWTTSKDLNPGTGVNTVRIDFDRQIPALFARTVPNQTFKKDNVVAVQIAYSKFEYDGKLNPKFSLGDMRLQLLELRAY